MAWTAAGDERRRERERRQREHQTTCTCPLWVNDGDYDGPEDYGRAFENAQCPLHWEA